MGKSYLASHHTYEIYNNCIKVVTTTETTYSYMYEEINAQT